MADTTFRTKVETTKETTPEAVKSTVDGNASVETPFSEYHKENGKPFIADYFQLGDTWRDEAGGFPQEVAIIEDFIQDRIDKGELPNNVESVKEAIKKIEKLTNLDKHERPIVKIDTIAAYTKFLMECDHIKFNLKKYANR